jgi:predicted enzyme related to lactoylglutathione lyase
MSTTTPSLVTGVDFLTVPSKDLDASVAFYRDTLGLYCSVLMPDRGFAEFETGPLTLSVALTEHFPMGYHPNPNPVALHVEDVEAARAELTGRGVEFQGDILDTGVCHMAFFSDPDGNALMLHKRYAPRVTLPR